MKISKVTVQNYRSICHAEVEPSAFNVLVGQNNHGKTNFFDAIEWFYTGSGDVGLLRISSVAADAEISAELELSGVQAGLAKFAGAQITKEDFETNMPVVFQALEHCWAHAHQN